MEVQVEQTGPCSCKISVTVPVSDVNSTFDKVYREVTKSAKIPGFRPGKVPRNVIEMHHGSQIRQEVQERLIQQSLPQVVKDNKVEVVAPPKVEPDKLTKGTAFSYTAMCEVRPEIELKKYQGLEIEKIESKVEEAEIETELKKVQEQSANLVPITLRDTVEDGDLVQLDYEGTAEGKPIKGAKAENAIIQVGSDDYLPGLSDSLLGAKVPGEFDTKITFPEDYSVEEWKGKEAIFHLKLKEIKVKEIPELDEDFAKDLGFESLEVLRGTIVETLEKVNTQKAQQKQRQIVLEELVKENPIDVPPSMVADQVERMISDAAARVQMMMGQRFDLNQLELENLRKENQGPAEFQVKSGLLLFEVSKEEKLEVTEEEINAEIEKIAGEKKDHRDRILALYKDQSQRNQLQFKLLEDKTIELLLTHANFIAEEDKKDLNKEETTKDE